MLLNEDDQPVLYLSAVQVGGFGERAERLAAMASEDGKDALGESVTGAVKGIPGCLPQRVHHTGPRRGHCKARRVSAIVSFNRVACCRSNILLPAFPAARRPWCYMCAGISNKCISFERDI